jgi:hypothetical protein
MGKCTNLHIDSMSHNAYFATLTYDCEVIDDTPTVGDYDRVWAAFLYLPGAKPIEDTLSGRYLHRHMSSMPRFQLCDLYQYLTFPQQCREILAFFDISFILFNPLPFHIVSQKFDFCPTVYVRIVFLYHAIVVLLNKIRTSGAAQQGDY